MKSNETEILHEGEYRLIQRPEKLACTWTSPYSDNTLVPGGVAVVHTDPVVGGKFHILMKSNEMEIPHEGEYRLIQRPEKLAFTWNSPYSDNTLVTVEFERLSARSTRVRPTHERFPDRAVMESHRGGGEFILSALEKHRHAGTADLQAVLIPFEIRPAEIEKTHNAIRDFLDAVQGKEPGTILYHSLHASEEPTRFFHYMIFHDGGAHRLHRSTEHVQAFVDILYPLCSMRAEPVSPTLFKEVAHG